MKSNLEIIKSNLKESAEVKSKIANTPELLEIIADCGQDIANCLKNGHKILICGNGGSASDALHFAGEIVGRFVTERNSLPAIALNADVATLTAIANDYGYDEVFARPVRGYILPGDILFGISTSGNSKNVINAVKEANKRGNETIVLTGKTGGELKSLASKAIIVPSLCTARIQESHICIIHSICEIIDSEIK